MVSQRVYVVLQKKTKGVLISEQGNKFGNRSKTRSEWDPNARTKVRAPARGALRRAGPSPLVISWTRSPSSPLFRRSKTTAMRASASIPRPKPLSFSGLPCPIQPLVRSPVSFTCSSSVLVENWISCPLFGFWENQRKEWVGERKLSPFSWAIEIRKWGLLILARVVYIYIFILFPHCSCFGVYVSCNLKLDVFRKP